MVAVLYDPHLAYFIFKLKKRGFKSAKNKEGEIKTKQVDISSTE